MRSPKSWRFSWLAFVAVVAAVVIGGFQPHARGGDPAPGPEYVGAKKCKACHIKIFKSWEQTKMAKSFDALKPGAEKEAKVKAKLDPDKDYTKDEKCLACHTVGFGKPGGYAIPPAGNAEAAERAALLEGVQCESCHGPGSVYIPLMKENESYPLAKAKELGLILPDKDSCVVCHNDKSPFVGPGYQFDFETKKKEGTHEHLPLKHPHE